MSDRPFDPQWTTDSPDLTAFLDRICKEMTGVEVRPRRRRDTAQASFEAAIKAIVLDLYRAHESDPALEVGIASGTTTLQDRANSRYGPSFLTARTFQDAMAVLEKAGLIVRTRTFWHDPAGKNSRTSRYQASPSLLSGLHEAGASVVALRRHRNAEGIRLKDADKKLVEYGNVQFANEARDRLRVINDMLESHWADLALTDEQISQAKDGLRDERDDEASQPFDFAARTVYRVFNNDDWEQGGRFYGAWWISIPSKFRPYIQIDGKRTVEVDYSGLHAAMLYAQAALPIPDDPYQRCVTKPDNKAERKLVKLTFNALLNADSVDRIGEIDDYSPEITGRAWDDFKRFVVASFPEFNDNFGSGVGLRLQRKDSDLAEAVMMHFAAMGYACLPVHDSFIVHHGMQDVLTDVMTATFSDMFGVAGATDFDLGLGETPEVIGKAVDVDIAALLYPKGHEGRLQAFRALQETE